MTKTRAWFIPPLILAALSAISYAMEVEAVQPVDTVVAMVEAWIQAHPEEGAGYRTLGRIHAMAWADAQVAAKGLWIPLKIGQPGELPRFYDTATVLGTRTRRPVTADDLKHLTASIAAYRQATELGPADALSELGLGWMLAQQGQCVRDLPGDSWPDPKPTDADKAAWSQTIKQLADDDFKVRAVASKTLLAAMPKCIPFLCDVKTDDPEAKARIDAVLRDYFDLQALEHYRKAFEMRSLEDLNAPQWNPADSPISLKAGTHILDLLAKHPEAARNDETTAIKAVVEQLSKMQIRTNENGPIIMH